MKKCFILLLMVMMQLTACSVTRMLPRGPVLSEEKRRSIEGADKPATLYESAPRVDFPLLPLMAFGITYDLDIVIVSKHPRWNMHEFAKISTPEGAVWLAKDAYEGSLDQCITVNRKNPYSFLPELPVRMQYWPIEIKNRSRKDLVDVSIRYKNHEGEMVTASYRGSPPGTVMKKRNGSTMGHSRNQLLAVLDVAKRDQGEKATISYNGRAYGIKKILGILPFQMILQQTQGGLATGRYSLTGNKKNMTSTHITAEGKNVAQQWYMESSVGTITAVQKNLIRTIRYHFTSHRGSLELKNISITQYRKKNPAVEISFFPPLPDMRCSFRGKKRSTFVIDVNGQRNHATGYLDMESGKKSAELTVIPRDPWWTRDRPLKSLITFQKNKLVSVTVSRIPE